MVNFIDKYAWHIYLPCMGMWLVFSLVGYLIAAIVVASIAIAVVVISVGISGQKLKKLKKHLKIIEAVLEVGAAVKSHPKKP